MAALVFVQGGYNGTSYLKVASVVRAAITQSLYARYLARRVFFSRYKEFKQVILYPNSCPILGKYAIPAF